MRVGFDYDWTVCPEPDRTPVRRLVTLLSMIDKAGGLDVELYLVTGVREDDRDGEAARWVFCQELNDTSINGIEYRPVYISSQPLIRRFESGCGKAKIINDLGIQLMFDDDLIQVACMRELCPDCVVCYVQPQLERFGKDMGLYRDLHHYVKLPEEPGHGQ